MIDLHIGCPPWVTHCEVKLFPGDWPTSVITLEMLLDPGLMKGLPTLLSNKKKHDIFYPFLEPCCTGPPWRWTNPPAFRSNSWWHHPFPPLFSKEAGQSQKGWPEATNRQSILHLKKSFPVLFMIFFHIYLFSSSVPARVS